MVSDWAYTEDGKAHAVGAERYYQAHVDRYWKQFREATLADLKGDGIPDWELPVPGQGLYLWGPTGTGKTHMLVALFKHYAARYPDASNAIITWYDLLDELKADFDKPADEQRAVYDFKHLDYLFIDDFLHGRVTEWQQEQAFSLINDRCRTNRATFFTSNLGIKELKAVDPALASRIGGMCTGVPLLGEDRRVV